MGSVFLAALVGAVLSLGAGAIAKDAKSAAPATLANVHASMGITCKQCHATKKPEPVAAAKCQTCHDPKAVAEKTASLTPANPHNSRHFGTEADCNQCHHQHKASESLCADCHPRFNFKVP